MISIEERIIQVLSDGSLSVAALRQRLRERWAVAIPEPTLLRALASDRFRQLAGDQYALVELVDEVAPSTIPPPLVSILNLPLLQNDFAVVDVETTGTDFIQDRVFQVAAVRFSSGRPARVINRYMSPAPAEVSDDLRRLLGIAGDRRLESLLDGAPSPESVLPQLQHELDGIPWVAHNATFDRTFLESLGLRTPFHIDTLELAGLVFPTAPSLTEGDVAELLGLNTASLEDHPLLHDALCNVDGPDIFGEYHNALTDVLMLSLMFIALQEQLPSFARDAIERMHHGHAPWTDGELVALFRSAGATMRSPSQIADRSTTFHATAALHAYLHYAGRSSRDEQDRMVEVIQDALNTDQSCACEAPTGTGKTLAYLFPALEFSFTRRRKAALCTATKNLQDQLAEELNRLTAWGSAPCEWAVLKGSGNYLCLSHLRRRLNEFGVETVGRRPDEFYVALYWICFAIRSIDGLVDEGPRTLSYRFPTLESWREEIKATTECRSEDSHGPHGRCFRAVVYAQAERSDVVVMNHALWLADRGGIAGFGLVVADEAHELENVATSFLEQEVTGRGIRILLRRLFDPEIGTGLLILAASTVEAELIRPAIAIARRAQAYELPAVGSACREFLRHMRIDQDPRYGSKIQITPFPERTLGYRWTSVRRAWREFADLLRRLSGALSMLQQDERLPSGVRRAICGVSERLQEQVEVAESALNPINRRYVHILDVSPETGDSLTDGLGWTLTSTPIDVSEKLREAYGELPAVFVSATLDSGVSAADEVRMRYSLDRIGLDGVPHCRRHILPSVLPYGTNAGLIIARAMVHTPLIHTASSFANELTEAYTRLLTRSHGKALLLFTARSRLTTVATGLRDKLNGIEVLIQGEDLSSRLLERFRTNTDSVLAGLKQFWQGVDVPGEALSLVFMEKLPFPLFADPLVRARAALVERRGGNSFEDYLLPGMLIAFKQGFGRLLRGAEDRGAVLLFDRRIATKAYLHRLESSLPGFVPRDPHAERTWPGIIRHLHGILPDLFSLSCEELEEVLPPAQDHFPQLSLPLPLSGEPPSELDSALVAFGFHAFRSEEQREVTLCQLRHQDVLGLMPTGSGKSLTFQLTALVGDGMTLVVSPLIALMRDQVEQLHSRGIESVGALYSGQSADERTDILYRAHLGRLKLLYVSPERLRDPVLIEVLRGTQVRALVVDEAHCVYSWGPHFRPEFLYIRELFHYIGRVPVAALTATAPPARRREILHALDMDEGQATTVVASFERPELRYVVYGPHSRFNRIRGPQDKLRTLLKLLAAARRDGDAAIVYVNTTAAADMLASQLQLAGFDARAYHGRMGTQQRHDVQDLFMDDHIRTVVCTKAFGMGVDKPGIRYVVHYDVPGDLVAYAQEAGRAGRNLPPGEEAWCVLLYYPKDAWIHMRFADERVPDEQLLTALAADIRDRAGASATVLFDTQEALERLAIGFPEIEETDLNVSLHRLAEVGFIRRGIDVVTVAVLCRVSECIGEASDGSRRALLASLPRERTINAEGRPETIDLLDLAARLNIDPRELSRTLAGMAVTGEIVFSPVRRAADLTLLDPMQRGDQPVIGAEERRRLRDEALSSWTHMKSWAEMGVGCHSVHLLQHLGEPGEPAPCGACDLCDPDRLKPWGDITDDDVPRPIDHVEVAGLLLEAILWNTQRPSDRDGAISGESRLWATLTANEFYLRRYGGLESARRCPFYGLFRSFPGREEGLRRLLDQLTTRGYIRRSTANFVSQEGNVSYEYPDLTEHGIETLRLGSYVNLEGPEPACSTPLPDLRSISTS